MNGEKMKVCLILGLCAVIFVNMFAVMPPTRADVKPDGCVVETYYSQNQGTVTRSEGGISVTQTITIRRYGQITSSCDYKEWLQSQISYGTNHVQWSSSGGKVKWILPTTYGSVTFSDWRYTLHDTEGYLVEGGIGLTYLTTYLYSVGNPPPGDMDAYWKSNNLPSGYYPYSLDVVIQACVSQCSSTTITLVLPYLPA
jgi:hypothetical protein